MALKHTRETDRLMDAALCLKTREEAYQLFEDLCTMKEIQDMAQRLEIAFLLKQGTKYQDVADRTGVSSATISRVNRCLRYGSDGYRDVLDRLKLKEKEKEGTE